MPIRCSANVAFLFRHLPIVAALEAAAIAGFHTVELFDPFVVPPRELASALRRFDLRVDLMNFPLGDVAKGERGFAGDPGRRAEFERALRRTEEVAEHITPAKINVLAGQAVAAIPLASQLDCLRDNLGSVADLFAPAGIKVVTELLNPIETPAFLLSDVATVEELIESLDGRVGFQLDVYQLQRACGELIPTIRALAKHVWHVQIADAPDRSEPGTGEINVPNVLREVRESGYLGLVGLEYFPSRPTDPFGWMADAGCVPA